MSWLRGRQWLRPATGPLQLQPCRAIAGALVDRYTQQMRAVGWHNGSSPDEPSGYGLAFSIADRDRHFDRSWPEAIIELDGFGEVTMPLSPSFWRSCSELRSVDVGRWLLEQGAAPWPASRPPGIAVRPIEGPRFAARVIRSRSLL